MGGTDHDKDWKRYEDNLRLALDEVDYY